MTNMECVEKLALTSLSVPVNRSDSWLELACRAERMQCPEVAEEFLARALSLEAEERERSDAKEWLELSV